jgi:sucrose phosphorylase
MLNAVQLITYVDRLGSDFAGLRSLLNNELAGLFGGVHVLPYFTPYDGADAGFDPADHLLVDERLGDWNSLRELSDQNYVMSDLIVNHMSNQSRQFQDVMRRGDESEYWELFLKRNDAFPHDSPANDIEKIYRPRPGTPFTTITLDNGTTHDFWTTFGPQQLDINVECPAGRAYLESVLNAFADAGVKGIRLDAVGYTIKRRGTECFMLPETFDFIESLRNSAAVHNMDVLVEIHSHYQTQIDIAKRVSWVYDFALPPLVLHTLFTADSSALKTWLSISPRNCITVLDTQDGIGIIDAARSGEHAGLLDDQEIEELVKQIDSRTSGQSRLASGQAASNLDIYQVNTTFYDALGRSDNLCLLARAIQLFVPGVPQIYYVGLLAGENDTQLLEKTGVGRDINRHYYAAGEIRSALRKPVVESLFELIRIRNSASAFDGDFESLKCADHQLELRWNGESGAALLKIDLQKSIGEIIISEKSDHTRYRISETLEHIVT